MEGVDLVVIALVAVMAMGTGQGTLVQSEEGTSLAIPTSCPAVDPLDRTIHLAHEVMCSLFYKCQAGEKIVQLCAHRSNGQLLYFNPELQVCDWPANVTCNYRSCILDSFGNTVKIPYDGSCQHYYDCVNGELALRRCPDGMKFDGNLKQCVLDSSAVCGPIQAKCDSIYMEPLADSCSFYVICLTGKNVVLPCPAGKFFSRSRQDCVDEINADCKPPVMTPHPSDCKLYYYNQDGMKVVRYCEGEFHFNPLSQKCEHPDEAGCTASTPVPLPHGRKCNGNSKSPHPTECRLYFECVNGTEQPRVCDDGLHFNPFAHVCQPPLEAGCDDTEPCPSPKPKPECTGNNKIPYPADCRLYQQCDDGIMKSKVCDEGLHFNSTVRECQNPCEARCDKNLICDTPNPEPSPSPKPECVHHAKSSHECDCRVYYECMWGSKKLRLCDEGLHFNPYHQQCQNPCDAGCDKSQICPTNPPTIPPPTSHKPECTGENKIPHIDCGSYYQCVNGIIVTKSCPKGLHFNPYDQECEDPCDAGCDKNQICSTASPTTELPTTQEPECAGDKKTPHADCGFYYQCENGIIVIKSCANGLHFNPFIQACQEPCDAGCDKSLICSTIAPPECIGSNLSPHQCDCKLYYECVNGIKEIRSCPKGMHFNRVVQRCQNQREAGCQYANVPVNQCFGNFKIPHEHSCRRYYECENSKKIPQACDAGKHFSTRAQTCLDPEDAKVEC